MGRATARMAKMAARMAKMTGSTLCHVAGACTSSCL